MMILNDFAYIARQNATQISRFAINISIICTCTYTQIFQPKVFAMQFSFKKSFLEFH